MRVIGYDGRVVVGGFVVGFGIGGLFVVSREFWRGDDNGAGGFGEDLVIGTYGAVGDGVLTSFAGVDGDGSDLLAGIERANPEIDDGLVA